MTSLENRNSSALFKRAEQLKRWSESDTNTEPSEPKRKSQRIQFTDGCVFLAACAASDKDEVERLQKRGADIDTANIDGLTALHQVRNVKIFQPLYYILAVIFFDYEAQLNLKSVFGIEMTTPRVSLKIKMLLKLSAVPSSFRLKVLL